MRELFSNATQLSFAQSSTKSVIASGENVFLRSVRQKSFPGIWLLQNLIYLTKKSRLSTSISWNYFKLNASCSVGERLIDRDRRHREHLFWREINKLDNCHCEKMFPPPSYNKQTKRSLATFFSQSWTCEVRIFDHCHLTAYSLPGKKKKAQPPLPNF